MTASASSTGSTMAAPQLAPTAVQTAAQPARPRNLPRTAFHVASGVFAVTLIQLLPGRTWLLAVSGSIAVAAWSMEIARKLSATTNERLMRAFALVAHPEERHRVNSSTWYVTALVLLSAFASPRAAAVGATVLAVADPAAGFIGRALGRVRLRAGRSLEGTLGFVTVGALGVLAWLSFEGGLPLSSRVVMALVCAAAGAVAELVSTQVDDNFSIPLVSACAATVVQWCLHIA